MSVAMARREFLKNSSLFALGLPLLPAMLRSTEAFGNAISAPKRLIFIEVPLGSLFESNFFGSTLAPSALDLGDGHVARTQRLADRFVGGADFSPVLSRAFAPFASKMNVIQGLDLLGAFPHHSGGPLLGNLTDGAAPMAGQSYTARPTADQLIAQSPNFYPAGYAGLRSLVLGSFSVSYQYSNPRDRSGEIQKIPSLPYDAAQIFDVLFGDQLAFGAVGPSRGGRIFSKLLGEFDRLKRHPRLSSADRDRMSGHQAYFSELWNRISRPTPCALPARSSPAFGAGTAHASAESWLSSAGNGGLRTHVQNINRMIAAAFRCDLTRVVTYGAGLYFTPQDWHLDWSHNNVNYQSQLVAANREILEMLLLDLLTQLDVPETPDGRTYLDNTLVVLQLEHSDQHTANTLPTITAGSAGGFLRTGMYMDYRNLGLRLRGSGSAGDPTLVTGSAHSGIYQQQLTNTILQAMGIAPSEYETSGSPGYGEIFDPYALRTRGHYRGARAGAILPGLRA